jgi:hypothetical protein
MLLQTIQEATGKHSGAKQAMYCFASFYLFTFIEKKWHSYMYKKNVTGYGGYGYY